MRYRVLHASLLTVFLFVTVVAVFSQKPHYFSTEESQYRRAEDLYGKQKYTAAQKLFDDFISKNKENKDLLTVQAEYYAAKCALFLFNNDAEYRLFAFISNHPESSLVKKAVFEMALFQYQNKSYRKAIEYFNRVDVASLNEQETSEYYFKLGYSYFMRKDYDKAKLAFYEIKDIRSDYSSPAIYYYAHIAYVEGNYQTALKEFRRLTEDENFSSIVPYYIVQILYLQKKYDKIIDYAPGILEHATPSRQAEITWYVGDAWFKKKEYDKALPYLEKYVEKKPLNREEHYELGYCYYKTEQYDLAVQHLTYVTGKKDKLAQNTYYLLADCFLHLGDKKKAGFAFSSAAGMNFDPKIKEDALFNYAKLTFELSYSPFNEAIRALKTYIEIYPYSKRINEAYHYLVLAYLNTKNYKLALESLDQIKDKNDEIKKAYQKVAFYRALELLRSGDPDNAVILLNKSLKYGIYNQVLRARAWYWMGESYYRMKDLRNALDAYMKFIYSTSAVSQPEYPVAHYSTGYVYFNEKKYDLASQWFRKYLSFTNQDKPALIADTYNRLGDCAFIKRNFKQAIAFYTKAYKSGKSNADYALYQRGFAYGLLKNQQAKIKDLSTLIQKFPDSNYLDNALYERGMAYLEINDSKRAMKDLQEIIYSHQSSLYVPKAYLQIGLIYYNLNNYKEAIKNYKQLIEKYPGTSEARDALTGLKNVYVDMNDVEAYLAYARELGGFANVSRTEEDSLMYISGENIYMKGDCDKAEDLLNRYIRRFPDGVFRINAHFYLAECLRKKGETDEALKHYGYVIRQPRNLFTEAALMASSALYYEKKDYSSALEDYVLLEKVAEREKNILIARLGQLRCSWALNNYRVVITVAKEIVKMDNLTEETAREAWFKMAKAYQALGDNEKAMEAFQKVAVEVSSLEGAESKYRLAELLYNMGRKDEAEKVIMKFINMSTPHPYWMAKAFLLLSDISLDKEDILQAKYTLQSLLEYYKKTDDGILTEAKEKLKDIKQFEQLMNAPGDSPEIPPDTIKTKPVGDSACLFVKMMLKAG
ncbi:MAG TPA: tetratricopeptide repeat protein [Bacteroidetes bacterium]|nr:tetratricopeptide repeat protein [Bacteroidota bacterium]